MMQRSNRKSHLTAPLSPATQALLRSEGPFSSGASPSRDTSISSTSKTPTSGEIPIATVPSATSSVTSYSSEPVQRVLSANMNGSNNTFSGPNPLERPTYPPRTSSTSVLPSARPRDSENQSFTQPTVMPIRPAPPPGGPLPQPPSGLSRTPLRRANGTAYHNGEGKLI